jgi:hypothetical protein
MMTEKAVKFKGYRNIFYLFSRFYYCCVCCVAVFVLFVALLIEELGPKTAKLNYLKKKIHGQKGGPGARYNVFKQLSVVGTFLILLFYGYIL